MVGISLDTSMFTRTTCEHDLKAYVHCHRIADIHYANSIIRNNIQPSDLHFFHILMDNLKFHEKFAFCYFREGCTQNLLGILADFVLSLDNIDFVVLCARNNGAINFSLRSEAPQWDASRIISDVLQDKGFSGGHSEMAGGVVTDSSVVDIDSTYAEFLKVLGI